ncbi:MAG: iron ABC transporter substrate-binding protein [Pseudodesulfovibrio sp.]
MRHCIFALAVVLSLAVTGFAGERTVTDSAGRVVVIPAKVERVICSGPGSLRLLTYLQAQDMAVAVDDIEARRKSFDARPYAIANPQYRKLPVFGQFRGHDNPELILALDPQPQVILKTYSTMGYNPEELQQKTGIPVVTLEYGNLFTYKPQLFQSLRTMGDVVGKGERAEAVIAYLQGLIDDLQRRTADVPQADRPTVFVGGVASKGPHGFQSTEPAYPPLQFVNAVNLAYRDGLAGKELSHADVAKEMIVKWNPDYLFLDLSTLQLGDQAGGWHELRTDPAYRTLTAVKEGRVYGLLPYNWYSKNYGCILANAYYIGKLIYPDRFQDVEPAAKADEIFTFLVGKPVFTAMDGMFRNLAYKPIPLN